MNYVGLSSSFFWCSRSFVSFLLKTDLDADFHDNDRSLEAFGSALVFVNVAESDAVTSFCQGMKQTIQCLQDQLNLLTMEAQTDYTDLRSASRSLQKPVQVLQENISR